MRKFWFIIVALLLTGSINLGITYNEELPQIGEAVQTIFGVSVAELAISSALMVFIIRTTPAVLALIRKSSESNSAVTNELLKTLNSVLQIIPKLSDAVENLIDQVKLLTDVVDKQNTLLSQRIEVMQNVVDGYHAEVKARYAEIQRLLDEGRDVKKP